MEPKKCPKCQWHMVPGNARFCPICGGALTTEVAEDVRSKALLDVRNALLGDQELLTSLAQKVAKVLKRGYALEDEDVDGVPHLEEL